MKIAIHHREGSFSEGWIQYCNKNGIDYKIVNAYANDIIKQIDDCDIFLWHHSHAIYEDVIVAKKLLFALEQSGTIVYPNFNTGWHFDDKVAQKYLLESINAPLIPSYVFYDKRSATHWVKKTTFPKVFKLKGGAGGANVSLVRNEKDALNLTKRAFGRGFSQFNRVGHLKDSYKSYNYKKETPVKLLKALARLAIPTKFSKMNPPEKGYIYFQDFIPDNDNDIRVVVIGGSKAVAEKRLVRPNDFRASGSGLFSYKDINLEVIKIAFYVADKLQLQSVAFDFVIGKCGSPLIIEMSYAFGTEGINNVAGYWDNSLKWHKCKIDLQKWLLDDMLKGFNSK